MYSTHTMFSNLFWMLAAGFLNPDCTLCWCWRPLIIRILFNNYAFYSTITRFIQLLRFKYSIQFNSIQFNSIQLVKDHLLPRNKNRVKIQNCINFHGFTCGWLQHDLVDILPTSQAATDQSPGRICPGGRWPGTVLGWSCNKVNINKKKVLMKK